MFQPEIEPSIPELNSGRAEPNNAIDSGNQTAGAGGQAKDQTVI